MPKSFLESFLDEPEYVKVSRSKDGACTLRFGGYVSERDPLTTVIVKDAKLVVDESELRRIRSITVPYKTPPIAQLEHALEVVNAMPGKRRWDGSEDRDNLEFCSETIRQAMQLPEAQIWPYFYYEPDFEKLYENND